MCGIAGFFANPGRLPADLHSVAQRMARQLSHRGPDDAGAWCDPPAGISLAHRRLSILDLSAAGHQPMSSHCGRYVLIFNGEIYNHLDLRRELESEGSEMPPAGWRGHSDTETLLAAIVAWGLEQTLHRLVGMFAFALWDRGEKALFFARDRLGEKPLYYGLNDGVLLFGSELKAMRAYPGFSGEVDRNALALFLQRNVVPAPLSIYRGIFKLPPGTWLKLTRDDVAASNLPAPRPYWSLHAVAIAGQTSPFQGSETEASAELERFLKRSIAGQMLADVPLGAFLSGGIDSSTVVALMQEQSSRPVKTYTIGFTEDDYDEAAHARNVAAHLGTDHTEIRVTPDDALAIIPDLPSLYDEPFADVSQIPTFLVSALARRDVSVCLSGDGGDELFGGYNRHVDGPRIWRSAAWLPPGLRRLLAGSMTQISPSEWDLNFKRLKRFLPARLRHHAPGDKIHKLAGMILASSSKELYERSTIQWANINEVINKYENTLTYNDGKLGKMPIEHEMMFWDANTYLPDDILTKVDRAAMANSLETRVPMLDQRVVEFAWTLPLGMKIRGNQGKRVLRNVLGHHIPRTLTERPKAGFSVPLDAWLRGPLKSWANELLDAQKIDSQGFLRSQPIAEKWAEHLSGKHNWATQIWGILMFQAWLEENNTSFCVNE